MRIAGIIGARVAVVALLLVPTDTQAQRTQVTGRTDVGIIARCLVEQMETAGFRIAGVAGANLFVVALEQGRVDTFANGTVVTHRASVAVVTKGIVGLVVTGTVTTTEIVGTGVLVIAVGDCPGQALPPATMIVQGTGVTVIARHFVVHVDASQGEVTAI